MVTKPSQESIDENVQDQENSNDNKVLAEFDVRFRQNKVMIDIILKYCELILKKLARKMM